MVGLFKVEKRIDKKESVIDFLGDEIKIKLIGVEVEVKEKKEVWGYSVFLYQRPVEFYKKCPETSISFSEHSRNFDEYYVIRTIMKPMTLGPRDKEEFRKAAIATTIAVYEAYWELLHQVEYEKIKNYENFNDPHPHRVLRRVVLRIGRYLTESDLKELKEYARPYVLFVSRNNIIINPLVDLLLQMNTNEFIDYLWSKCDNLPLEEYYNCVHKTANRIITDLLLWLP